MKKIFKCYLGILFASLFLSGCWDQTAIEERAYVVALGIDKAENENQIKITYLITNPELSKQEVSTSEPPQEIITFAANDIISAKNMANTVIAKQITYNLVGSIIVSEEVAKEGRFINLIYDAVKEKDIKRSIPLIVTKENASTFLIENKPKLETRFHKYLKLILEYGNESGYIPNSTLHTFFRITEADQNLYLGIYGTTKTTKDTGKVHDEDSFLAGDFHIEGETNKTQFSGSAIFKKGKMVGTLTGEETRISILLNNTLKLGDIINTYPDPNNKDKRISTRVMKREKNNIEMNLSGVIPTINLDVPIYLEVLSDPTMVNYGSDEEKKEELKKYLEELHVKKINKLIKKMQEEYKGEPFGWSLIARKHFKSIPEFEAYNWMEKFSDMEVNVSVDITLAKFGRQSEVPDIEQVRD